MKALSLVSRILCFVCVALMLALIIVQFLPNWTYTTKEKNEAGERVEVTKDPSLAEITWYPTKHKDLTGARKEWDKFMNNYGKELGLEEKLSFKMNGLVPMPILSMAAAAIGIFVCAIKNKAWGSAIFPIISGWALANAMMTHPILQTGANCQLMQLLGIITAAVGAVTLVTSLTAYIWDYVTYKKAMAK